MSHLFARAIGLSVLASTAASAAVVVSNVNLSIPDNGIGLYVNFIDGTTYSGPNTFPTNPGPGANYDFNIFGGTTSWSAFSPGSSGQSAPTPVPAASKGYVAATTSGPLLALTPGTVVGPSSVFNSGTPSATAISTGLDVFIGLRFRNENDVANANDDTLHYGWALINLPTPTLTQNGTLIAYGYESTPNTPITIPIPEPTSLSLVGLLAAVCRRRR